MTNFLNPYHFVPISRPASGTSRVASKVHDVQEPDVGARGAMTHDRYVAEDSSLRSGVTQRVASGRIVLSLETLDPVVLGAEREPRDRAAAMVRPCIRDEQPILPASSLRGLISAVAEAVSNSALRVLSASTYSYRVGMQRGSDEPKPLSAMGMLVRMADNSWRLLPMALPTLENTAGGDDCSFQVEPLFQRAFREVSLLLSCYPLKVYFGRDRNEILALDFRDRFLAHVPGKPSFYALRVNTFPWRSSEVLSGSALYRKRGKRSVYLISQKSAPEWLDPLALENGIECPKGMVRGIVRVLGATIAGREGSDEACVPPDKRHEVFLPFPAEVEEALEVEESRKRVTLAIDDDALARFDELARECETPAPYFPWGSAERDDRMRAGGDVFREGDIVFFDLQENSEDRRGPPVVSEISYSSMWRRRVEHVRGGRPTATTAHHFFDSVGSELLPMNPDRSTVTIAEQMFGYVEEDSPTSIARSSESNASQPLARSFASKLRFASGMLETPKADAWMPAVTLKILSSPKPPSPNLYFRAREPEQAIRKSSLKGGEHFPMGRKFYVPRQSGSIAAGAEPWRTRRSGENANQKSEVSPLRSGLRFWFHIDFDNLTDDELGLLCWSLSPVEKTGDAMGFVHRLGMGKALGLGAVALRVEGVFGIDRRRRYLEDPLVGASRYHRGWVRSVAGKDPWPLRYSRERSWAMASASDPALDPKELARRYLSAGGKVSPEILNALRLLGARQQPLPVHYPNVIEAQKPEELEANSYEWFVANEDSRDSQQRLRPIGADDKTIPVLSRIRRKQKK